MNTPATMRKAARSLARMLVLGGLLGLAHQTAQARTADMAPARCAALVGRSGVNNAVWHASGLVITGGRGQTTPPLPAHCEVTGALQQRTGADGQAYAVRFHMRLPADWNRRFFFQGGGGSNGVLGDATGYNGVGNRLALVQHYAVVSQDSGHDNRLNNDPARGSELVFGFDPVARRNYGHASLKLTNDAAHDLLRQYYRSDARYSYFYGCSKGGQEGMQFSQAYPASFDGIVAAAPGFSLPKAALAQIWDVQTFAAVNHARTLDALALTFSAGDFKLVRDAILEACDGADGVRDGMVLAVGQCTTARVQPALARKTCTGPKTDACLAKTQVDALLRSSAGARNSAGSALYAPFPWDPGIGLDGWRGWKIGTAAGMLARNVVLGAGSLAAVFTSPPTALRSDPAGLLEWSLAFDFDRDAPRIFARTPEFPSSGWDDVSARSPDLVAFAAHGGKMIVPQGAADPVFSLNDTLAWWDEVDAKSRGHAADVVRVFPVPGMNHCAGGNATDRFDAFKSLVDWVEHGRAPTQISAAAGAGSPWPGRTRPLCPYPQTATYAGSGDIDRAASFHCTRPATSQTTSPIGGAS